MRYLGLIKHKQPTQVYRYSSVRSHITIPTLFVSCSRDRIVNMRMVERDGYAAYTQAHKKYLSVVAGHLDVVAGYRTRKQIWPQIYEWLLISSWVL